jgi:hypothetical protein
MFTDAASYDGEGNLRLLAVKAHPLPHLKAVVAARAAHLFMPTVLDFLSSGFESFDDIPKGIVRMLRSAEEVNKQMLGANRVQRWEVVMAGWSASRGPSSLLVANYELPGVPAWTVWDPGPMFVSPYDETLEGHLLAAGLNKSNAAKLNVEELGLTMLEAQRHIVGTDSADAKPVVGVGGFAQETIVTADWISTRMLKRWPDKIGAPINPG